DLVVTRHELEALPDVLNGLGYDRLHHVRGRALLVQHQFVRTDSLGVPHALDVHWRIAAPLVFRDVLTAEVLRSRAVPIPELGSNARGPSLPDALAIACVHLAAHHRSDPLPLWLEEIATLAAGPVPGARAPFLQCAPEAAFT